MNTDRIEQWLKEQVAPRKNRRHEGGYALVGLMGVMLVGLILTTVAAPSVKLEAQREREAEMLWRGQQVAKGLEQYVTMRRGQFPTELNELVEGLEINGKKMHFLRPSAMCDPMTPCNPDSTNWRLVHPGDPLVKELLDVYVAAQQKGDAMLPPPPASLVMFAQLGATRLPGQETAKTDGSSESGTGLIADTSNSLSGKLPIIGVVSRKSSGMFRNYLGIEQYDHSLFFPGVPVVAGGFANPLAFAGPVGQQPSSPDTPQAPTAGNRRPCTPQSGGIMIDGQCYGGVFPGVNCRGPNNTIIPCKN